MTTNFGVEININKITDRMAILMVMSCQKMVTQSLFFDSLISSPMVKMLILNEIRIIMEGSFSK